MAMVSGRITGYFEVVGAEAEEFRAMVAELSVRDFVFLANPQTKVITFPLGSDVSDLMDDWNEVPKIVELMQVLNRLGDFATQAQVEEKHPSTD